MGWFDLSPLRPDDYKRQDAERWNEAVTLQRAIQEGKGEAGSERTARERIENKDEWPEDHD